MSWFSFLRKKPKEEVDNFVDDDGHAFNSLCFILDEDGSIICELEISNHSKQESQRLAELLYLLHRGKLLELTVEAFKELNNTSDEEVKRFCTRTMQIWRQHGLHSAMQESVIKPSSTFTER